MTITGTRFGQYQVVSMLGVGGMGEVYLAQDTGLKRLVALKLISTTLALSFCRTMFVPRRALPIWLS